ncbi:MAG: hypothetical protein V1793_11865 [Pseudomonadota bacterium]
MDNWQITDRRRKKDIWAWLLTGFNVLSWIIILAIVYVTGRAKPEFESFFDRFYHLDIRVWWDLDLIRYLLYLAVGGAVLCCIGLMLSLIRARRRDDRGRIPILFMGIVSATGLICVLVFF